MQSKTARGIILVDDKIISIKRTKYKNGKVDSIYYTFPGGHLENNETFEETLVREVDEELGITINIENEYVHIFNEELNREEKFFLCKYVDGEIGTGNGPEFTNIDYEKYGKYDIVLLDKKSLKDYNLLPLEIRDKLINDINCNKI